MEIYNWKISKWVNQNFEFIGKNGGLAIIILAPLEAALSFERNNTNLMLNKQNWVKLVILSWRGGERSYSTSFLINLDPDILTLAAGPHQSAYDLCLNAMVGHTERIFRFIQAKSKRDIDQVHVSIKPFFHISRPIFW